MPADLFAAFAQLSALVAIAALIRQCFRQAAMLRRKHLLAEQGLAGTRAEAETTHTADSREQGQRRQEIGGHFEGIRAMLESELPGNAQQATRRSSRKSRRP